MIKELKESDIGKTVYYVPNHAKRLKNGGFEVSFQHFVTLLLIGFLLGWVLHDLTH